MSDDEGSQLSRLKARTPEPRAGLTDAIMRQVALRPRPKRPWWTALTRPRELVIRFRWSRVMGVAGAAAVAAAALFFVKLDGRRPIFATQQNSSARNSATQQNSSAQNSATQQNSNAPDVATQQNSGAPDVATQQNSDSQSSATLVRFVLPAKAARAVSLAGDFNGWRPDATPLLRDPDGTWRATLPLAPGTWRYSFVVDGKWVEDPAAESYRADGFGGRNALVRVGG